MTNGHLIHPLWSNSGLLESMASDEIHETHWFANASLIVVIFNIVIPILGLIIIGFWLKDKYLEQKEKISKREKIRHLIEQAIRS